jgi:gas vesicle protein
MKRALSFMRGIVWGGLVGAAVGMLFAPASGEELQTQLRERAETIREEVTRAAAARRAELEHELATLRAPKDNV